MTTLIKDEDVRAEVKAFARLMEAKLRANEHKGSWKQEMPVYLIHRLQEEVMELASIGEGTLDACVLRHNERPHDPLHRTIPSISVGYEAADVGNFAMMLADVCGALKGV